MGSSEPMNVKTVWREYKRTHDRLLRDRILEHYLPIVRFNAERIHVKLPSEVELDDLIQAGVFGLADAVESFDLDRGVKFETFCSPRIRGAILDELRNNDWVPRLVRSRHQQLLRATNTLINELERAPSDKELAQRLNVNKQDFERIKRDANAVGMLPLSRKLAESNTQHGPESDFLEDRRSVDPVDEAQKRDLRAMLNEFLDYVEQLVLVLYYYEGLTMKEIGVTLYLSESRVSQMHSAILDRLRRKLAAKPEEVAV